MELTIETLEILKGKLPQRVLGLVLEWAVLHRDELRADWERVDKNLSNPFSHWSKNMDKVVSVKALDNYLLEIEFEDGLRKTIDIRPFIGEGTSAALKDETCFRQVNLENGGGITWPNGYDFCPSYLRDNVPAVKVITA